MSVARHVRGSEWQLIRQRIITERGRLCQRCGKVVMLPEPLILHHKDKDGDNDSDNNLILVCEHCHEMLHGYCKEEEGSGT